jgi:type IV secretory pathway TraG/TraD family ATPase VirD4
LIEFDWVLDEAAAHNERDWERRLPGALTFLLAPWREEVGTVSLMRAGWMADLIGLVRRLCLGIFCSMFALLYFAQWQNESKLLAEAISILALSILAEAISIVVLLALLAKVKQNKAKI